jgi:hypothetical protein
MVRGFWATVLLVAACGSDPDAGCALPLSAYCAGDECPTLEVLEGSCVDMTYTEIQPEVVDCDGFTAIECSFAMTGVRLYMFDAAGALAAYAYFGCGSYGEDTESCPAQGGWYVYGPTNEAVLACTRAVVFEGCYE